MRKLISVFVVLCMIFIFVDTVFAVDPIPDIKANGSDEPITSDNLSLTVELDPDSYLVSERKPLFSGLNSPA